MKYNLYAKITILTVSTIVSLYGILEIVLRCYTKANSAFVLMPDDTYLRYRGKPHSSEFNGFRLNSRGYKDEEFNTIKKPGVFRIIGIGDSHTYGAVPYQYCYITLLKKKIMLVDNDCEVLNLGIPAAGPVDYLSLFVNEGVSLHPDMVLVNIFTGDDFDFRLPNRILAREFNRLEIEYLDLLDFFLDSFKNNMKSFNKPNDPHWNLYGNRFAVELVNPWLLKQINRKRNRV